MAKKEFAKVMVYKELKERTPRSLQVGENHYETRVCNNEDELAQSKKDGFADAPKKPKAKK